MFRLGHSKTLVKFSVHSYFVNQRMYSLLQVGYIYFIFCKSANVFSPSSGIKPAYVLLCHRRQYECVIWSSLINSDT